MTLAEDLRPALFEARAIAGTLGLRPHTIALVIAATSGANYTGDGNRSETVTPITEANGQPPKIRWLKSEERAVGQLPDGSIEVGPITPAFPGGGTLVATLTGADALPGQLVLFRVTGPQHPNGADYRRLGDGLDRALHYTLRLAPVGDQT